MKKIVISLFVFVCAFISCANGFCQTFVDGFKFATLDTPQFVIYGWGTYHTAAVKSGNFQCDSRYFPTLAKAPDNAKGEWSVCYAYQIQGPEACVPKLFGGTGVGMRVSGGFGIKTSGWISWWCPNADPIKSMPVVIACTGLTACTKAGLAFVEHAGSFAEAARSTFTTSINDQVLRTEWSDPESVALILSGRP
jgi:hypothetical protein